MIKFNKNIPIFVFDLHDVIVRKNYKAMCLHIIKLSYRLDLALLVLHPFFLYTLLKLLCTSRVPEQYVIELSKQHPRLKFLIPIVISIMNEQIPIFGTMTLIEQLKNNNFPLYLFSNIGERTFAQFKQKYPMIVTHFDGVVITQEQDQWIQKPQQAAFEKCIATLKLEPTQIIFIDNSKKNIETARNHGFRTIWYQNSEQLRLELQKMGYLFLPADCA